MGLAQLEVAGRARAATRARPCRRPGSRPSRRGGRSRTGGRGRGCSTGPGRPGRSRWPRARTRSRPPGRRARPSRCRLRRRSSAREYQGRAGRTGRRRRLRVGCSPCPSPMVALRLTRFARGGGCAAKLRLGALSDVLDRMTGGTAGAAGARPGRRGRSIRAFSDDAAVVRPVGEGRGLVLTTDVIAPLVDDPEAFGEIAATNAISDVYAMGGRPSYALNLVFFPDDALSLDVLHAILRGGARACARAGVAVVGGHSVRDPEVKFGMAVAGEVELDQVLSNRGAAAGEALILSKAIGTGIIGNAIKADAATADEIAAAIASMTTLNGGALGGGAAPRRHRVHRRHRLRHLRPPAQPAPWLGAGRGGRPRRGAALARRPRPRRRRAGARRLARQPRVRRARAALGRRRAEVAAEVRLEPARELALSIACDAQTSGGLLLCVPGGPRGGLRRGALRGRAAGRGDRPARGADRGRARRDDHGPDRGGRGVGSGHALRRTPPGSAAGAVRRARVVVRERRRLPPRARADPAERRDAAPGQPRRRRAPLVPRRRLPRGPPDPGRGDERRLGRPLRD